MRLRPSPPPPSPTQALPVQALIDVSAFARRAEAVTQAFAGLCGAREITVIQADAYYAVERDALLVRLEIEPGGAEPLARWASELGFRLQNLGELDDASYRHLVTRVLPRYTIRRRAMSDVPGGLARLARSLRVEAPRRAPTAQRLERRDLPLPAPRRKIISGVIETQSLLR